MGQTSEQWQQSSGPGGPTARGRDRRSRLTMVALGLMSALCFGGALAYAVGTGMIASGRADTESSAAEREGSRLPRDWADMEPLEPMGPELGREDASGSGRREGSGVAGASGGGGEAALGTGGADSSDDESGTAGSVPVTLADAAPARTRRSAPTPRRRTIVDRLPSATPGIDLPDLGTGGSGIPGTGGGGPIPDIVVRIPPIDPVDIPPIDPLPGGLPGLPGGGGGGLPLPLPGGGGGLPRPGGGGQPTLPTAPNLPVRPSLPPLLPLSSPVPGDAAGLDPLVVAARNSHEAPAGSSNRAEDRVIRLAEPYDAGAAVKALPGETFDSSKAVDKDRMPADAGSLSLDDEGLSGDALGRDGADSPRPDPEKCATEEDAPETPDAKAPVGMPRDVEPECVLPREDEREDGGNPPEDPLDRDRARPPAQGRPAEADDDEDEL